MLPLLVVVSHGMRCDYSPIRNWGLNMHEWNMQVDDQMLTNIPGIHAAGDFVTYPNKVELIAGMFTNGIVALRRITCPGVK
ncbi:FAD-dependent oxidoreductase [Paenibacillus pinihumi]|uniref:FAD-dependent oxidoreductase n=1 Tax=Paenibacillus pinihumi TaxID=669462 RepID=UPI0012B5E5AA|nr:FAD-dependent oxidoreductase [Paenibacillus pinihumi]